MRNLLLLLVAALPGLSFATDDVFVRDVLPVLDRTCLNCHHSDGDAEAGLDLERFESEAVALAHRDVWLGVYEKLESHQMPPPRRRAQPTLEQRQQVLRWIEAALARPDPTLGAQDPGKPILRRLNRLEYNNTLRDLLGLNLDVFLLSERQPIDKRYFQPDAGTMPDELTVRVIEYGGKWPVVLPLASLPGDGRAEHGFNNRGDALNLSALLLESYLSLASELVRSSALSETPFYRDFMLPPPAVAGRADLRAAADRRIRAFLPRAFRRPLREEEAGQFLGVFDAATAAGAGFEEAMRRVTTAILCAPGLIYRSEPLDPQAPAVRPLDGHELASRLSYFLWASLPDDELRTLADSGELTRPEVLAAQARRMLRDPRVRELSDAFAVQWLRLDQIFAAKPDPTLFPQFYSGPQGKTTLHTPALIEPLLLFETILIEDRSILDLVDARFTYLNPALRRLYGLPEIELSPEEQAARLALPRKEQNALAQREAQIWRRTPVTDPNRGGVITMAGPLIVTSLPDRTSPVKRGAWLLETICNRPPAEPKVAFALEAPKEEDTIRRSVRERFELHRNQPACFSCHVRLDPPGFALEAFSPIGTWRTTDNEAPVDASGEWNGHPFTNPAGFKAALLTRPEEFTRGFVEHLLSYALGRRLEHYDMPHVNEIVRSLAADEHRFSAVITRIVTAYPFRYTRNLSAPDIPATVALTP